MSTDGLAGNRRNVVVIGGSAGSLQALENIFSALPHDLAACLFVVHHRSSTPVSPLPGLLGNWGSLPVALAAEEEALEPGRVRVAPADHHLLLSRETAFLRRGPRENCARPAIDPLFRSAAVSHRGRVIAVLLSGYLSDGAAGLDAVKRCGGLAVVQDPDDAQVDEMPRAAIEAADVDFVVPAKRIGDLVCELVGQVAPRVDIVPAELELEARMAAGETLTIASEDFLGRRSPFACPDCGGNLWEMTDERLLRFRCHVGHAYTGDDMLAAQHDELDKALWSALRALRERATMLRRLADDAGTHARNASQEKFLLSAEEVEDEARSLQRFLLAPRGGGSDGRSVLTA